MNGSEHGEARGSAAMRRLPVSGAGPRTGAPVRTAIVGGLFAVALAGWLAATIVLCFAAGDLTGAAPFAGRLVLAVHLVTVVALPAAVTAAALHLLPVMLRNDLRHPATLPAIPGLLVGGFLVAAGVGLDRAWLTWPGVALVTAGLALVLWQLVGLLAGAPRGRMVVASRVGVGLVCAHVTAALLLGAIVYARGDRSLAGVSHERLVLIHLHLAVVGWLALLIITVGRTLIPMLAMAPAAPRRSLPLDELCVALGLWVLLAGIALAATALQAVGGAVIAVALVRFAVLVARTVRSRHAETVEAPLGHVLVGVACAAQAVVVGAAILVGAISATRGAEAYVLLILVGWAAGITVGHAGKLMSLSVWAAWPPGPRPKQHRLYPRRLWQAETILFAVAVETLTLAILIGGAGLARAGAITLAASALVAVMGTAQSWRRRSLRP